MDIISTVGRIYSRLGDDISKEYFKARLLYSTTGDYAEICRMVSLTYPGEAIREKIKSVPDAVPFIWGAGFCGAVVKRSFPDVNWFGFIDSNLPEQFKYGLPVLSPAQFRDYSEGAVVVVASTDWHTQIIEQLEADGFPMEKVIDAGQMILDLFERQYFDLPYLRPSDDEVFVDGGCFDGSTVRSFIKWAKGTYDEILAFEPDSKCFHVCGEKLADVRGLSLNQQGLWNEKSELSFSAVGDSTSKIMENGEERINAIRLDGVADEKKVSFIKMDIEGAEKQALLGAADTIRKYRPKLAICIYHKPEDIWEIPELILEMNPDYHLYIRHYSLREAETVLYAV